MNEFPIYIQKDSMQCGITCIQMICHYYGKKYTTEFVSKICPSTTEGVSLLSISNAAKRIGINAISGKVAIKQIENIEITSQLIYRIP